MATKVFVPLPGGVEVYGLCAICGARRFGFRIVEMVDGVDEKIEMGMCCTRDKTHGPDTYGLLEHPPRDPVNNVLTVGQLIAHLASFEDYDAQPQFTLGDEVFFMAIEISRYPDQAIVVHLVNPWADHEEPVEPESVDGLCIICGRPPETCPNDPAKCFFVGLVSALRGSGKKKPEPVIPEPEPVGDPLLVPPGPGYRQVGWQCLYHEQSSNGFCHNPLDCDLVPRWALDVPTGHKLLREHKEWKANA